MFSTFALSQHFHQYLVFVDFLGSIQSLRFYLVLFVSAPLLMAALTASTSWAVLEVEKDPKEINSQDVDNLAQRFWDLGSIFTVVKGSYLGVGGGLGSI